MQVHPTILEGCILPSARTGDVGNAQQSPRFRCKISKKYVAAELHQVAMNPLDNNI